MTNSARIVVELSEFVETLDTYTKQEAAELLGVTVRTLFCATQEGENRRDGRRSLPRLFDNQFSWFIVELA